MPYLYLPKPIITEKGSRLFRQSLQLSPKNAKATKTIFVMFTTWHWLERRVIWREMKQSLFLKNKPFIVRQNIWPYSNSHCDFHEFCIIVENLLYFVIKTDYHYFCQCCTLSQKIYFKDSLENLSTLNIQLYLFF